MDAQLKAKWVEALRSGNYEQTVGRLKCENSYCCLGVLAVVSGLEFDGADDLNLPDWDGNYHTALPVTREQAEILYHMNDGVCGDRQHSFEEIASHIEKYI